MGRPGLRCMEGFQPGHWVSGQEFPSFGKDSTGAGSSGCWDYFGVLVRLGVEVGGVFSSITTILSQVQPLVDYSTLFLLVIIECFHP